MEKRAMNYEKELLEKCESYCSMVSTKATERIYSNPRKEYGDMKGEHMKLYDESKILYEIYRMRGLTIAQLVEVVFKSKIYAYRYLKNLQESGWLSHGYDTDGKIRLAKVYFCTDKAIERLEKEGYIEKGVKAKDNKPPKNKLKYTILTNEVYAALSPYQIHMYDSREWKRMNRMDRNTLVRGGLRMSDGRELGLYLFFSPKQISGAGFSDSMLTRFKYEIQKFPQRNRIAVLCYDQSIYTKLVKAMGEDSKSLVTEELLVIPMGKNDFGYNLLRMSRNEEERRSALEEILNAHLHKEHHALKGNILDFAQYVADYGNKETYVVDFLSMNRPILHHLSTHYYDKIFQANGRKVDLICWKASEGELRQKFLQYPHINIVPVSMDRLTDTYIPRLEKTKLIES